MFIAAHHDRRRGKVIVWEKLPSGSRVRKEYPAPWYFYEADRLGDYETITGVRVKRVDCTDEASYEGTVLGVHPSRRFESDFDPVDRVLQDNYSTKEAPVLIAGLLDIEVDYKSEQFKEAHVVKAKVGDQEQELTVGELRKLSDADQSQVEVFDPKFNGWRKFNVSKYAYVGPTGFAGPKNPYAPINALTVYHTGKDEYITWAVPPKSWDWSTKLPPELACVILCKDEAELLERFMAMLPELDVLSGWNSEFYDIPYITKRVELVFGQHAVSLLGFEGGPEPRWSERERFKHAKVKDPVVILGSRVHLDYMRLFKKFNLKTRQSFSLNAVGLDELNEPKVHYPGTLEELYNNDFILFLIYNIGDVRLVKRLNDKFKYIELANQMVHMATVNFESVFGSVQMIDSAIINYSHNVLKKIVIDKKSREEGSPVEGAIVMTPKPGFYKWIGSVDINSLYPSTLRSLNISPEMIIGQLLEKETAWHAFYEANKNPDNKELQNKKLHFLEDQSSEAIEISVGELIELCKAQHWAISGYGTIFDQSRGEGLVPAVLTSWFKGRKEMQGKKKSFYKEYEQKLIEYALPIDDAIIKSLNDIKT